MGQYAEYAVTVKFEEAILGTAPLDKELYKRWLVEKALREGRELTSEQIEDELKALDMNEELERGTTGFLRTEDGTPCLMDYYIKGFFKDACGMLRRVPGSTSRELTAYKKIIDGLLFVYPRFIPINVAGDITFLERPLRAETAQGERIALARSEQIPAGSSIEFQIEILGVISKRLLKEWFDYGSRRGLGCWRNSGMGRFSYSMNEII